MHKIDFQDGGHLGFLNGTILAIFDQRVTLNFLSIFESIQEKFKIDFQAGHLGFPIGMILAVFDLQVTKILPTKFRVSWPFRSEDKGQNRFSRPSWISDQYDFRYF